MLTGPVGKSGELSQSSLLARACLGPTRNDGSDVAGNRMREEQPIRPRSYCTMVRLCGISAERRDYVTDHASF